MRPSLLFLCVLALTTSAWAGSAEFLPDASLRLQAGGYTPVENHLAWDAWIGGGASLVRWNAATAYMTADVETVLGNERRTFDALQANYHLEGGARLELGAPAVTLFFHHVSRHEVDRPKLEAVDWNVLGARIAAPFPAGFQVPGRVELGVGYAVQESNVGYRWEATGRMDADLVGRGSIRLFVSAYARYVNAVPTASFPRDDFVDFTAEGGVRFSNGPRVLSLFGAFDHRNDVYVQAPGVLDRGLFGFRIGVGSGSPTNPAP